MGQHGALYLFAFLLCLMWSPTTAYAQTPDASHWAELAHEHNPDLAAMRSTTRALESKAKVAGSWTDPTIAIEYSNAPVTTFGLDDHPMAGLQFRVQQTLAPPSWSNAKRAWAEEQVDSSKFSVLEAQNQLTLAIEKHWWALTRTRLLKDITASHLERTEELLQVAQIHYETGHAGQHMVLRLTVLRDQLQDQLGDFERDEHILRVQLIQAFSGEPNTEIPTPTSIEPLPSPKWSEDWSVLAQTNRPKLSQLKSDAAAAQAQAKLAMTDALPKVNLWAGYRLRLAQSTTDPGTDLVSIGVGVPIPSMGWRRAHGERDSAQHMAESANSTLEATNDSITAQTETIVARWDRSHKKALTYAYKLIPNASDALQTTQSDFSVGRAEFATLFDAEVSMLQLEGIWVTAVVDTHIQKAELTAALGIFPEENNE